MSAQLLANFMNKNEEFFDHNQECMYSAHWMICRFKQSKVASRGLSPEEFSMLCYAKSRSYTANSLISEEKILDISHSAFSSASDSQALELMLTLPAVGISTASAALTWVYPNRFAILDTRVIQALYNLIGMDYGPKNWASNVENYFQYLAFVSVISVLVKRRVQEVDVWLYNFARKTWKATATRVEDTML